LQKRPIILSILLTKATPYDWATDLQHPSASTAQHNHHCTSVNTSQHTHERVMAHIRTSCTPATSKRKYNSAKSSLEDVSRSLSTNVGRLCCSILQYVAVSCAACCSVLQYVAVVSSSLEDVSRSLSTNVGLLSRSLPAYPGLLSRSVCTNARFCSSSRSLCAYAGLFSRSLCAYVALDCRSLRVFLG